MVVTLMVGALCLVVGGGYLVYLLRDVGDALRPRVPLGSKPVYPRQTPGIPVALALVGALMVVVSRAPAFDRDTPMDRLSQVVQASLMVAAVGLLSLFIVGLVTGWHRLQARLSLLLDYRRSQWDEYASRASDIKTRVILMESDIDTLLRYPALADTSLPAIGAFWESFSTMNQADSSFPEAQMRTLERLEVASLDYPHKVAECARLLEEAYACARRVGQDVIGAEERRTLDKVSQMLDLVRDRGASENERVVAYRRASRLLEGLAGKDVPGRLPDMLASALQSATPILIQARTWER